MNERDFVQRISNLPEGKLSNSERERIESALKSEAQDVVRDAVRNMADEEPSLAWRGELNRKLAEASVARRRAIWSFRPALGLGLAGALGAAVLLLEFGAQPSAEAPQGIEAAMAGAHRQAVNARLVAGTGVYDYEARPTEGAAGIVWQEADLRGL